MDAALPLLVQRMLQPDFYPHPVQTPVQLLQTHISYVFLTGEFAYKVKKPTQFGRLDFSNLEQRAYFCQEELRLNRRLSPGLYLAVLPIYGNDGDYYLKRPPEPGAEIVDYALQMRQFDQEGLFSHLLNQGQLTAANMQQLGQSVARFHATAETSPEIQANGTLESLQAIDEENYTLTQAFMGKSQTKEQWQQTRRFTQQFWQDHQDWLQQRQDKIRDCHGDLHLNNVCLHQDRIQIFDCIEFCREFRHIDVMYDVAFMVMDLDFLHRKDLANVFLNTYLEKTGDYEGALLLPAYLSMRATIRGNVNSMTAQNIATSDYRSSQKLYWQNAKEYFALAHQYTQPRQGQIILMSGLSGSGKSTVAHRLAPHLNAIHIRSDAVRKHLAGISLDESGAGPDSIYTPAMTQRTYQRLRELGISLAQMGWTVILDAKYDRVQLREQVLTQAELAQIPVQILFCTAPVAELRSRLQNRRGDISDATPDLLVHQKQTFQAFTTAEKPKVTQFETQQDLDAQLTSFCQRLAKRDNVRLI
ncbi:bifunctional aminoglycoside phosphotransferase/ATP-binding protein [Acaryochloris marina]|uniref:gluconokinase n=1 Tax=Acaryochloris marina (strain MBIC 11017) TaxID=329726 RepID=B0CDC8_ACAM1|nr:bifunctional aminoglycoside phosphotransferase/ATP-binding protein [Acaryochloris marina]ABW26853.1 conserved hypothetical protein [Acaryochloris marina MBIC11017]BDM81628.1 hypothetical protein AM10699_44950 [Acaryochloris marina MBIC10699]